MIDWLEKLKPGDTVVVLTGYVYTVMESATVTCTTPTQVIVGHNRYRKDDGSPIGHRSTPDRLVEATPERLELIARKNPAEKLSRCGSEAWAKLPAARLSRIVGELEAAGIRFDA